MKGIDLCCQQHTVDWAKVKQSGEVEFIVPRTGWGVNCDGSGIDPKFLEYVSGAQKQGIAVPAVYHFIYAHDEATARQNAACAIAAVQRAGLPKSTIIWCDQEEDTVINAKKQGYNVTTSMQRNITEAFCDYVLQQGYCTGVYLNQDYLTRVYGKGITQKYDIWLADLEGEPYCDCVYRQYDWHGQISGIPTNVDRDVYLGRYTAGTAKPKVQEVQVLTKVGKFITALQELGDGRYYYYGEGNPGIGCSDYVRLALQKAGIIKAGETFWAGQGQRGILEDKTRFQRIPWDPKALKAGDILWSQGHHVAVWDGGNGVYEGSPVHSHGVCDNGRTGVGRRWNHTYWNCGTGTNTWDCIYRIIDPEAVKEDAKKEVNMDKAYNIKTLVEFLPDVKYGSTGQTVKALQTILAKYGWYTDAIDGSCGPNTTRGNKLMQTALGLTVDGWVGQYTWSALLIG